MARRITGSRGDICFGLGAASPSPVETSFSSDNDDVKNGIQQNDEVKEDDISTLFTENDGEDFESSSDEEEDLDEKEEDDDDKAFQKEWDQLERHFSRRDRLLSRITQGKTPRYVRQMQRRETLVRRMEREQLLIRYAKKRINKDGKVTDDTDKRENNEDTTRKETSVETSTEEKSIPWYRHVYDSCVFEWSIVLPSAFSLILHCMAHQAICECLDVVEGYLGQQLGYMGVKHAKNWLIVGTMLVGLVLLRASGYLYWWLNDQDYACIKFDFHNRLKLESWDARALLWIKKRSLLRCAVYTIGYNLCWNSCLEIFEKIDIAVVNERKQILNSLPSRRLSSQNTTTTSPMRRLPIGIHMDGEVSGGDSYKSIEYVNNLNETALSKLCQTEVERVWHDLLRSLDLVYTERSLMSSSFHSYWIEYLQGCNADEKEDDDDDDHEDDEDDSGEADEEEEEEQKAAISQDNDAWPEPEPEPLYRPHTMFMYCVVMTCIFVGALQWYGFVFWEKY